MWEITCRAGGSHHVACAAAAECWEGEASSRPPGPTSAARTAPSARLGPPPAAWPRPGRSPPPLPARGPAGSPPSPRSLRPHAVPHGAAGRGAVAAAAPPYPSSPPPCPSSPPAHTWRRLPVDRQRGCVLRPGVHLGRRSLDELPSPRSAAARLAALLRLAARPQQALLLLVVALLFLLLGAGRPRSRGAAVGAHGRFALLPAAVLRRFQHQGALLGGQQRGAGQQRLHLRRHLRAPAPHGGKRPLSALTRAHGVLPPPPPHTHSGRRRSNMETRGDHATSRGGARRAAPPRPRARAHTRPKGRGRGERRGGARPRPAGGAHVPDATPGREWGRLKGPRGRLRRRVEGMRGAGRGGETAAIRSSQPPARRLVVQEGKVQRRVG